MQIQLTGRMWVRGDDGVELGASAFPGRQGRVVFAYLVLAADPVPRDQLADLLWPHGLPPDWRRHLAAVVSKLRRLIRCLGLDPATALPGGGHAYQLCITPRPEVDVEVAATRLADAESAARHGDRDRALIHARGVTEVVRRPFLPEEHGEWVAAQRNRLDEMLLRALDVLAAAAEPPDAVRSAEEAMALRPLREAGHLNLMRAHLRAGNRAEALLAHQRCRQLLREELGVDPAPEVEAAYLAALRPAAERPALPALLGTADRGVFVGRGRDLARLHVLLANVSGGPHLAHLTGEPGIGKTRLAIEFARAAHAAGGIALLGRCDSDHVVPYQPFVEALRHVATSLPAETLRGLLGPWAPELTRLLPQLAARLPGLATPRIIAPDTARYRLFEGVSAALAGLARIAPVVLVVDDLPRTDRSTLALLRHVLRSDHRPRLLVVSTGRDGDIGPEHAVALVLGDLHRDELVSTLPVPRLDEGEVAAMLGTRAGFAADVHHRTAGNPFFVRQLIRHLDQTDADEMAAAGIPGSVVEAVRGWLSVLDDDAWRCLTVAAVIGHRFDVGVVARVTGLPVSVALDALERAGGAGLVVELPGANGFAFVHDLVHEAIYGRLGSHRRMLLHRAVAEAVEMLAPDSVAQLAGHYLAAGPAVTDRAARYAVAAAEAALAQLAYEDAARLYEAALAALPAPGDAARRGGVLLALGTARSRAGDPRAGQALRDAAAAARRARDGTLLARAALELAATWAATGAADHGRIQLLDEALAALPADEDRLRARLLAALAGAHYWDIDPAPRARHAATALGIARRLGDPATLAACLEADNAARWAPGDASTRRTRAREIVDLAAIANTPELAVQGHAWGILAALELGDRLALDAELAGYQNRAEQLRQPRHCWYLLSRLAMRAILSGDFAEGERLAAEGRAIAVRAGEPDAENLYLATMFPRWLGQPRQSEAYARLNSGIRSATNQRVVATLTCARLLWDAWTGGDETEYQAALEHLNDPPGAPRDLHWMFNATCLAGAAAQRGDREQAERLTAILSPYASTGTVWAGAAAFLGSVDHWLGTLAMTLGRWRQAHRHLTAAEAFHQRLQSPPWIARTRSERARLPTGTATDPGRAQDRPET